MTIAPRQPLAPSTPGGNDLVLRARSGDREAREELARAFGRPAYLLALQLLGNPEDARDAAQEGLMRFFSRLDRLDPGRPVRPWLLAIVRNAARDLARRRRVRQASSLDAAGEAFGVELIDDAPGPETLSRREELRRKVWRALGELRETEREILVLRDYQDLSYAEIAAVLGVPLGTVMSRLHRARRALRALLAGDYAERPGADSAEGGVEP